MGKKNTDEEKKVNEESFFYKFKTDKKFNAKAQLIFYVLFIIFVIIYLNVSSNGRHYDYNNITNKDINTNKAGETNLYDVISDNYNYSITVEKDGSVKYIYTGKRNGENTTIDRKFNNKLESFYKIGDEYYLKENDNYKFIDSSLVYDTISYKYLEFDSVMKLIKKANLEHVENTTNGDYKYIYNLLVRDIVKTYTGDDVVTINVNVTDYNITIDIDYTNLFKLIYTDFTSCKINYVYSEVGKVLEFTIIEKNNS